ncbi:MULTISPECIES: flavin reductase family protein [Brevibacterium]|uniref:Flavin reductase family protein n=1 Tax=Brevibacterium pityocampae TaxID=506594 RepID=A0ABP8JPJ2_9MICO|nr:flavin reductase family protein [Brevibacterium sp. CS2]MCK1803678.1 flavin reductase family protein [Brevibacterium sp. R8603A2]QCP05985.1 flavin reductase family protein [Brevibacterium sp. CS2]
MNQLDPEAFKHAFRHHPAGVAVISAASPDGPVGLTVSSVASVSAAPPALLFSVTSRRGSASRVLAAPSFVVNLLSADQVEIARSFAVPGAPRFTPEQGWRTLPGGEPVLPGVHAALLCEHLEHVEVGESIVVVAAVREILADAPRPPLVYVDRTFHALTADTPLP